MNKDLFKTYISTDAPLSSDNVLLSVMNGKAIYKDMVMVVSLALSEGK